MQLVPSLINGNLIRSSSLTNIPVTNPANNEEIAIILSSETGKTLADATGDVWRGIEVVEQTVRFYTETKTITARWFEDDIPSGPNMTISLK